MSQMKLLMAAILWAGLGTTVTAQAQGFGPGGGGSWREGREESKTYVIELDGENFRLGGKLNLKEELSATDRRLRRQLADAELESVVLMAKSRHGGGSAELNVEDRLADTQNIAKGRQNDWTSNRARSYNEIDFQIPRRQRGGDWILRLNGNIKIYSIEVTVKTERGGDGHGPGGGGPGGPGGGWPGGGGGHGGPGGGWNNEPRIENMRLGTLALNTPILPTAQSFSVNEKVKAIKLRNTSGMLQVIQVVQVTVEFRNGEQRNMPEFNVTLNGGQEIEIQLNNDAQVRNVVVTALAVNPLLTGQLAVSATVEKNGR